MKIVILAAGEGKRLRPHTNKVPKCMVELAGRPLLSYQLATIKKFNILTDDIALVGGYKIDAFKEFFFKKYENVNYASTNMVKTLFCARDFMQHGEDLIISYGDIIYEEKVLKALFNCHGSICVAADTDWERLWRLRMNNPLNDAETFIMDEDLTIKEIGKKPRSYSQVKAQYMGLIKIRGDMITKFIDTYDHMDKKINYDGQNFDNMYMTSLIQHLIDTGWQVKASLVQNGWLEVDTVDDLKCYDRMAKDGSLDDYCRL
ncbi:MAG: phosphocholine cytidylyltransferase family protein [Gammaproteobacteria bacterium]